MTVLNLGAPVTKRRVQSSAGLIALVVALGIYFPFLGGSMILVAIVEHFVLKRIYGVQKWLGLSEVPV